MLAPRFAFVARTGLFRQTAHRTAGTTLASTGSVQRSVQVACAREYAGCVQGSVHGEKVTATLDAEPTTKQLSELRNRVIKPWAAFGFCDNMVMLLAGDFIDAKLGALGLTALGAAGMGNIISDSMGIIMVGGLAVVLGGETACARGTTSITAQQLSSKAATLAIMQGRIMGLVLGAVCGLLPLVWPENLRLWEAGSAAAQKPNSVS